MSRGSSAARLPIACRDDALAGGGGPGAMTDPFARQRLDGKVLVVTGAGEGLGAAIARRAAAIGAAGIVVCGRDARRGEAVREELEGTGTEALFVAGDLADPQTAPSIVDARRALRPARRSRQRRRAQLTRHARRHQRRAVGIGW